jgi:hypothetical protein
MAYDAGLRRTSTLSGPGLGVRVRELQQDVAVERGADSAVLAQVVRAPLPVVGCQLARQAGQRTDAAGPANALATTASKSIRDALPNENRTTSQAGQQRTIDHFSPFLTVYRFRSCNPAFVPGLTHADAAPLRALSTCGYGTGKPGNITFTLHWHVNCPGGSNYVRAWADCYNRGTLVRTARGPVVRGEGATSKANCVNLGINHKYGYDYGPTGAVPYRVVLGG